MLRRLLLRLAWFPIVISFCLCGLAGGMFLAGDVYSRRYSGRIYPGVQVQGVRLDGLTVAEAALVLQTALPDPAALPLILRDRERTWVRTWADLGLRMDPEATARMAYQVGRSGTFIEQRLTVLQTLITGRTLPPVVLVPDPLQAREALHSLAAEIFIPPVNATLIFQGTEVIPVAGKAGSELDLEATLAALPYAIGITREGVVMDLLTRPVPPPVGEPGAALTQARDLLARPFQLIADDPLTGFTATLSVEPSDVARWLVTTVSEEQTGNEDEPIARLVVTVDEEAVRAYLEGVDLTGGEGIGVNVERSVAAIREAVEAGESQAKLALLHYPRTYIVQPGDTATSVAYAHGFPLWRLLEANPGLDQGTLQPGQHITIPSLDVLFPLPLVTERRIVVDLSDQRLYAYQGDALVFDFTASTGIPSSPTIPGVFQVLSKEEEAYASSWDLWMPHFMGIYYTAPDFVNGIHGLPTLSNGTRLWEGVLGRPVSYGCVVLGLREAATLYEWAPLGTLVVIQP
ncbi:MAG: peptidoglycan binding domain-containing protein [Anaerolineae bacterium]|nr:peptidoglycan binding domain-containing protein [Anaerolineae bacterium]